MLQKQAILYVEKFSCTHTTGETGDDDIWLKITVDGQEHYYPSESSRYHIHRGGGTQYVDVAINVTYVNHLVFELIEYDTSSSNDWIGSHTLTRSSVSSSPESRTVDMDANGSTSGEYTLTYRIISDPIPTLRVLGIRCEQQSAGMNVAVVEEIAAVASEVTSRAGDVISKSPRPRAKVIGEAFEVASIVLAAMSEIGEWIGRIIEGKYDEVYMDHVEDTRGYNGAFFPPDGDYVQMKSGDDLYFEQAYGRYFRFPLDRGPITLQFREHDNAKADVNIGTLTIAPDSLDYNSSAGVSGTTVNGGIAVMDGPAVVELAHSYGKRQGEGALYHICYSVGFEDWCKPATTYGQGDFDDMNFVAPEPGKFYGIISKRSGKALTVESSRVDEDNANIHQWRYCDGTEAHQSFELKDEGDGYYAIVSKRSGKALTISDSNIWLVDSDGTNICQWDYCNGTETRQSFRLINEGDGCYGIVSKRSEKALSVNTNHIYEDGANIFQWTYCNGTEAHQSFGFILEDE